MVISSDLSSERSLFNFSRALLVDAEDAEILVIRALSASRISMWPCKRARNSGSVRIEEGEEDAHAHTQLALVLVSLSSFLPRNFSIAAVCSVRMRYIS